MPLQCPITLADTYQLKCANLSGIILPVITISKNNFSEISYIPANVLRLALSTIVALDMLLNEKFK